VFSSDIKSPARLQAIELRNAAESFLVGPGYTVDSPAARLDAFLCDAPHWLIARLSYKFFSDRDGSLLEGEIVQARTELGVDPVVYAASGVGLRTFLRLKAGAISNAGELTDMFAQEVAETEARLAAKSSKDRASSRRYLREIGQYEFDLTDAISLRRRQSGESREMLPAIYGEHDLINCPSGLALRRPSEKEARVLAREWADGWLSLSPENAIYGKVSPLTSRITLALQSREAGRMLGVFDGENLVGSLMLNRVSETQVELGWFTIHAFRGRGVATAALVGLLASLHELGFEEAGVQCFPDNQASMKIITKLGFAPLQGEVQVEGTIDWLSFTARIVEFAPQNHPSP
jgi:[ribosomal protein S5]-alanine N-acetyltransferase